MDPEVDQSSLILIGRVMRAHGVRGELKVFPETDDPGRLQGLDRVFIGKDVTTATARTIRSVRLQHLRKGTIVLMVVEGVDSREAADALRQAVVFAEASKLPALEEDEFYWHDLVGWTVMTTSEVEIGKVKEILEMPAQQIFLVAREGRPDSMIPAVPEFIEDIDTDAGRIVIRPIEGLLDD